MNLREKAVAVARLRPECIECTCRKYLTKYPEDADPRLKVDFMQKVCSMIADAPESHAVPVIVRDILELRKEMFGEEDDYTEIKRHFNDLLLSRREELRKRIEAAADPLMLSLQIAMIGNYIDFAVLSNVDEGDLDRLLMSAETKELDRAAYEGLKKDLGEARRLVYFTDNCGEIVLDRLLIEEILKQYPNLTVSVIVRGMQAVNDATVEDAVQAGLDEIARIQGNGNGIMGTWLPETSEEALALIEEADVMIAKGQANFETLRHCGLNIYYLFLCKCSVFSRQFQVPEHAGILVNEFDPRNY